MQKMTDGGMPVTCRDGCGAQALIEQGRTPTGWQLMEMARGYRCPNCVELLRSVNGYSGSEPTTAAKKQ